MNDTHRGTVPSLSNDKTYGRTYYFFIFKKKFEADEIDYFDSSSVKNYGHVKIGHMKIEVSRIPVSLYRLLLYSVLQRFGLIRLIDIDISLFVKGKNCSEIFKLRAFDGNREKVVFFHRNRVLLEGINE